jgi:hypothetical protein
MLYLRSRAMAVPTPLNCCCCCCCGAAARRPVNNRDSQYDYKSLWPRWGGPPLPGPLHHHALHGQNPRSGLQLACLPPQPQKQQYHCFSTDVIKYAHDVLWQQLLKPAWYLSGDQCHPPPHTHTYTPLSLWPSTNASCQLQATLLHWSSALAVVPLRFPHAPTHIPNTPPSLTPPPGRQDHRRVRVDWRHGCRPAQQGPYTGQGPLQA